MDLFPLRLDLHVLSPVDEADRETAIKLILFLTKNILKFSDLSSFCRNHEEVLNYVNSSSKDYKQEVSKAGRRLSVDGRLAPQGEYYDVPAKTVCNTFNVNPKKGLKSSDIEFRRKKSGPNELIKPARVSVLRMLLNQVLEFMIIILLVAAIASAAISEYAASVTLFIVVVVNVIIGFVQEYKAEKALSGLLTLDVPKATAMRDSERIEIDASELVPGDLVLLEEGDSVPADIRLIETVNLEVLEAVLTGESESVKKDIEPIRIANIPIGDRKNMAFMSTSVVRGRGKGVVVKIGSNTEAGKISASLNTAKQPKTPLQRRLHNLGLWLVFASVFLCLLIISIGLIRGKGVKEMLILGISLGVSVIPEGLVAVTTVTMAIGVQRMAKKNAVIRKLSAVETLGSVSTICSDKTGTLTEGKMRAVEIWLTDGTKLSISGEANAPEGKIVNKKTNEEYSKKTKPNTLSTHLRNFMLVSSVCSNSEVRPSAEEKDKWDILGDPTEIALVIAAMKAGCGKKYFLDKVGMEFHSEVPFDSNRKRMSVVYYEKKDSKFWVLGKGATESVLSICTHVQEGENIVEINDSINSKVSKQVAKLSSKGLRVLALAYKDIKKKKKRSDGDFLTQEGDIERDLIFLGLCGIVDPPRPEVAEAIKLCHQAGIRVCMITGDHQSTAAAIADQLGIVNPLDRAMRGVEIDLLAHEKRIEYMDPFPTVFARVSPENKLQIVEALQNMGEVVAMTGDGVNDAPAIKKSDCGVAMGITGTDITKQSASIILSDDNFESITRAVEEGRIIYDNIMKFILYLMSCNSAEILVVLITVAIGYESPFTTMQILWANIIADVPPSMALGVDPPEKNVMERPPRNPKKGILTKTNVITFLVQGLSMAGIAIGNYLIALEVEDYVLQHARVATFFILVMVQLFHGFISRSKTISFFRINPLSNLWMLGAFLLSAGILVASIYIPGMNTFFDLVPVTGWDWAKAFISMAVHLIITEIVKLIFRCCIHNKQRSFQPVADVELDEVVDSE